ncbi:MAG: glycosyltransferase family 2 protein [Chloroflexi bacterium]|nr:glycosyltransferase family 2 protein [Chloroflexota bacterium]
MVVVAFNEERWIGPYLRSLRAQDYPRPWYEIIVVDNGSTDRTAEIARSLGARVVFEPVRGVARARQRGAAAARGEILAGTDADAMAPPSWLAEIGKGFARDPALAAMTGPILLYRGTPLEVWFVKHISNGSTRFTYTLRRGLFPGTNFAVRASEFWRVGGFNSVLLSGEDIDLAMRLSAVAKTMYNPEMVMYVSARRAGEGYRNVFLRASLDFIRVVLLGLPPSGKDFVPIR